MKIINFQSPSQSPDWEGREICFVPKEGFGNEGCWVFPLVTMLQRGNVEKILVAHGFNRGKNEYKEIKL